MKAYFLIVTPASAWRINKPTILFRLLAKLMGFEVFIVKDCPNYRFGAIITDWDKVKSIILEMSKPYPSFIECVTCRFSVVNCGTVCDKPCNENTFNLWEPI